MAKYTETRFCENLNISRYDVTGAYDIPVLQPYAFKPTEFVGFNFAKTAKDKSNKGIHFFVDDYQFERVWRSPTQYIDLFSQFQCVMTPDFSTYTDYPRAIQIYNHYRKHWIGALLQSWGIDVIPTISWSDKESFAWCFDGTPAGATVAVSSVGTQKRPETKKAFLDGWFEMCDRLQPETIIFHGEIPKECTGNIIRIKSFQEKFMEVKTDGWSR